MRRLVGMKLLVVLGFAALALGQTDDQGSGPRDVPRRGSSSSDGAKDVDVAVPPEIEKQFAGLVGQAQVNGRNNRGGNRLLDEEGAETKAAGEANKQFAGLVGQAQVNGRNNRGNNLRGR